MVVGIFWNLMFENRFTKYPTSSRNGNCSALNYVDRRFEFFTFCSLDVNKL